MIRDPFTSDLSPGRVHLTLRTLAANDNVPLDATAPPRRASANASTFWPLVRRAPLLRCVEFLRSFAEPGVFPAPDSGFGVEAGRITGVARP